MPKFQVVVTRTTTDKYLVEATTKEEAWQMGYTGIDEEHLIRYVDDTIDDVEVLDEHGDFISDEEHEEAL